MFLKATHKTPYMGLNNKVCDDPKYWCRLHEVWLSDEDVKTKNCNCKLSYDMLCVRTCACLEKREITS